MLIAWLIRKYLVYSIEHYQKRPKHNHRIINWSLSEWVSSPVMRPAWWRDVPFLWAWERNPETSTLRIQSISTSQIAYIWERSSTSFQYPEWKSLSCIKLECTQIKADHITIDLIHMVAAVQSRTKKEKKMEGEIWRGVPKFIEECHVCVWNYFISNNHFRAGEASRIS